ncbi:MAG: hypothetical protein DRJ97_06170 [Thermoprotei archaeon]|nr:MAG: hypothetical protein DRJ97_06170 [Thermoprotei archaeon]
MPELVLDAEELARLEAAEARERGYWEGAYDLLRLLCDSLRGLKLCKECESKVRDLLDYALAIVEERCLQQAKLSFSWSYRSR